jgi:hypothetical protein
MRDGSFNLQESRVLRGGSFIFPALYVRSSHRLFYVPANRDFYGFRPSCSRHRDDWQAVVSVVAAFC